jgi:hypothetical protein
METLFEPARVEEALRRVRQLRPESERLWGSMKPEQMLAHCTAGLQMAMGQIRPPRALIGRLIGRAVKRAAFRDEEPMRRNSPTARELVIGDNRDFAAESERLCGEIGRFAAAGPAGCTTHPHPFFGRITPEEWAALMYKHLDHHLRQFGA